MTAEQLKLFSYFYTKFNDRCSYICHTLLKDLNNYKFMSKFKLDTDLNEVDCYGEVDSRYECEECYECFPADFIYKSDEEILQWKNEILEKQRKEREEKEKIRQQREQEIKYQKYMELKRVFEK